MTISRSDDIGDTIASPLEKPVAVPKGRCGHKACPPANQSARYAPEDDEITLGLDEASQDVKVNQKVQWRRQYFVREKDRCKKQHERYDRQHEVRNIARESTQCREQPGKAQQESDKCHDPERQKQNCPMQCSR